MTTNHPLLALGLAVLAAMGTGCNSDSNPATSSTTLSGTAAVGAPLSGATITATCSNGATQTTTSNANGNFTLRVAGSSLPCALQAVPAGGGTALHAVTTGSGVAVTVNITPLTDLIAALAVNATAGTALATWFNDPVSLTGVSDGMAAAQEALADALAAAGYTVPSPFQPVSARFVAAPGNAYDDLLEAIAAGITGAATDYAAVLAAFVASGGATLPSAPDGGGGGGDPDPEAASGLELVALYAGTWQVTGNTRGTVIVAADGSSIDFDTGQSYAISGSNVYNRIPNFPSEPRVQIELFPTGESQQRIRIYVDPANKLQPLSFVYYPSVVTEVGAITATVAPPPT